MRELSHCACPLPTESRVPSALYVRVHYRRCVMKAMNPTYTADGHLTRSTILGVSRRMTLADKAPLQPPSPLWCCAASQ